MKPPTYSIFVYSFNNLESPIFFSTASSSTSPSPFFFYCRRPDYSEHAEVSLDFAQLSLAVHNGELPLPPADLPLIAALRYYVTTTKQSLEVPMASFIPVTVASKQRSTFEKEVKSHLDELGAEITVEAVEKKGVDVIHNKCPLSLYSVFDVRVFELEKKKKATATMKEAKKVKMCISASDLRLYSKDFTQLNVAISLHNVHRARLVDERSTFAPKTDVELLVDLGAEMPLQVLRFRCPRAEELVRICNIFTSTNRKNAKYAIAVKSSVVEHAELVTLLTGDIVEYMSKDKRASEGEGKEKPSRNGTVKGGGESSWVYVRSLVTGQTGYVRKSALRDLPEGAILTLERQKALHLSQKEVREAKREVEKKEREKLASALGTPQLLERLFHHSDAFLHPMVPPEAGCDPHMHSMVAKQVFMQLLQLMGDFPMTIPVTSGKVTQDLNILLQQLMALVMSSNAHMLDEVYLQLMLRLTDSPSRGGAGKGWVVMSVLCGILVPHTLQMQQTLCSFLIKFATSDHDVATLAQQSYQRLSGKLKTSKKSSGRAQQSRMYPLSKLEIAQVVENRPVLCRIFLQRSDLVSFHRDRETRKKKRTAAGGGMGEDAKTKGYREDSISSKGGFVISTDLDSKMMNVLKAACARSSIEDLQSFGLVAVLPVGREEVREFPVPLAEGAGDVLFAIETLIERAAQDAAIEKRIGGSENATESQDLSEEMQGSWRGEDGLCLLLRRVQWQNVKLPTIPYPDLAVCYQSAVEAAWKQSLGPLTSEDRIFLASHDLAHSLMMLHGGLDDDPSALIPHIHEPIGSDWVSLSPTQSTERLTKSALER